MPQRRLLATVQATGQAAEAAVEAEAPAAAAAAATPQKELPPLVLTRQGGPGAQVFVPQGDRWFRTDDSGHVIARDEEGWFLADASGTRLGAPAPGSGADAAAAPGGAPPEGCWALTSGRHQLSLLPPVALQAVCAAEALRPCGDWLAHLEGVMGPVKGVVYDIGCGAGTFAARLLSEREDVRVVGVDVDPVATAAAKLACPAGCFRTADAGKLHDWPADAGVASGVWATFVAAHFPHGALRKALLEWQWLLRPGGWMFLVDLQGLWSVHRPMDPQWARQFRDLDEDLSDTAKFDPFAGSRLVDLCRKTGLEVLDQQEWTDMEFVFSGHANEQQLALWRARLQSPVTKALFAKRFRDFAKQGQEVFMECLRSPEHSTRGKVTVVVCCKPNR